MLGIKKSSHKAGLPPGTLIHIGERKTERATISRIIYSEKDYEEKIDISIEEAVDNADPNSITWINVDGIHDTDVISRLGAHFKLHPLLLEDIVNTSQRPKLEDFDEEYIFFVSKMLTYEEDQGRISIEQLSMVIGKDFVLSFQEAPGDVFDQLRERIRSSKGKIRKMGTDYLAYAMIDAIVDNYFIILEKNGERLEDLQEEVLGAPTPEILNSIQQMKRDMIRFRRSVWPLREAISAMERGENVLITKGVEFYLRDLYDHTIQVLETVETFRDMISGILDLYLSSISNRMNQVMKVLTIIATIFIPLTFIAGIYGMNFEAMPELKWRYGYLAVWVVMISIGIVMLIGFKKRKWL